MLPTSFLSIHFKNAKVIYCSRPFGDIYNKAIDEIWYKRAVEQYYVNNLSFVYSVPFDVGFSNDTLVTASRAVFIQNKAPAAVVGYQFRHSAMSTLFFNTVSSVSNTSSFLMSTILLVKEIAHLFILFSVPIPIAP